MRDLGLQQKGSAAEFAKGEMATWSRHGGVPTAAAMVHEVWMLCRWRIRLELDLGLEENYEVDWLGIGFDRD